MGEELRGAGPAGAAWVAIGPACVACTIPAFWHAAVAMGLLGAATWLHYSSLAATPLIGLVVLANWRHHRDGPTLIFTVAGLAVIAVHIGMHIAFWQLHSTLFNVTNQFGLALLTVAVVLNTRVLLRLRGRGRAAPIG